MFITSHHSNRHSVQVILHIPNYPIYICRQVDICLYTSQSDLILSDTLRYPNKSLHVAANIS